MSHSGRGVLVLSRRSVAALSCAALLLLVAGCVSVARSGTVKNSGARHLSYSTTVDSGGAMVQARFGAVTVTAHARPDAAEPGTTLTVESAAQAPAIAAQVGAAPSVRISLGDTQPASPVELTFDLSGDPGLTAQLTGSMRPLISVDSGSDLLPAQWNPRSQTVTAASSRLGTFTMLVTDPLTALSNGITQAYNNTPDASTARCAAGDHLTINGVPVTIVPSTPEIVGACLRNSSGALTVDFDSMTQRFYTVTSTPPGTFTNQPVQESTDRIAIDMNTSAGLATLTPRASGSLAFPSGVTVGVVRLDVDAAARQLQAMLTALGRYGLDWDSLANAFTPGTQFYGCVAGAHKSASQSASADMSGLINALGALTRCAVTAAHSPTGDSADHLYHRIGVAGSQFASLPEQRVTDLAGAAGPSGADHLVYTLVATPLTAPVNQDIAGQ